MTVLLVLFTFAIFLTIDYFYAKAKRPVVRVAPAMTKAPAAAAAQAKPSLVGGWADRFGRTRPFSSLISITLATLQVRRRLPRCPR